MASFKLTDADGAAYKVDAPDEQSAYAAFQKMQGGDQGASAPAEEPPEMGWGEYGLNLLRKGVQGATFGLGDEAVAGVQSLFGGDYDTAVARERQALQDFGESHPIVSIISEIVGSLPTAGGLAKSGLSLVGRQAGKEIAKRGAARAAGTPLTLGEKAGGAAKVLGAGAVEGAGYGAAYGAGTAEGGPEERAQGAIEGAPWGAAGGLVAPAVGAAVNNPITRGAVQGLRENVLPRFMGGLTPEQSATRRIADVVSPGATGRAIAAGTADGVDQGIAAVGGQPTRDMLKTAASRAGDRGMLAENAERSARSAVGEVQDLVERSFNAKEGAYQIAKDAIRERRAGDAEPFYQRFYGEQVTPEVFGSPGDRLSIAGLLNTPVGRAGLAAAKQNAGNRREPWAKWFEQFDEAGNPIKGDDGKPIDIAIPQPRALDEIRGVIKDAYEDAKRVSDKGPFSPKLETKKSLAIKSALDDLTTRMDKIGAAGTGKGAYAVAREVAGDAIKADEAIEFGRNVMKTHPTAVAAKMGTGGVTTRSVKPFAPEERELARIGLVESMAADLRKAQFGEDAIRRVFGDERKRAVIRAMFDTNAEYRAFERQMLAQAANAKVDTLTMRAAGGDKIIREGDPLGEVGLARQTATFGPVSALLSLTARLFRQVGGMSDRTANEIGRKLMTKDPQEVRRILQDIRAVQRGRLSADRKKAMVRRIATQTLAGIGGRSTGGASGEYQGVE